MTPSPIPSPLTKEKHKSTCTHNKNKKGNKDSLKKHNQFLDFNALSLGHLKMKK